MFFYWVFFYLLYFSFFLFPSYVFHFSSFYGGGFPAFFFFHISRFFLPQTPISAFLTYHQDLFINPSAPLQSTSSGYPGTQTLGNNEVLSVNIIRIPQTFPIWAASACSFSRLSRFQHFQPKSSIPNTFHLHEIYFHWNSFRFSN